MTVSTAIASRLDRLEQALGDGGNGCSVCASRPKILMQGVHPPEPDRCPQCGREWVRRSFTWRIGPPLGLLDTDEQ